MQIREDMQPTTAWSDDAEAAVSSGPVASALDSFFGAASQSSGQIAAQVGAAASLLGGLSQGATEIDQALVKGLGLDTPPTGIGTAPQAGAADKPSADQDGADVPSGNDADGLPDSSGNAVADRQQPGGGDPGAGEPGGRLRNLFGRQKAVSAQNGSPELFDKLFPELKDVNPNIDWSPGDSYPWQNNCQDCVFATDEALAGRGHLDALPRPSSGFNFPSYLTTQIGGGNQFRTVNGYDDITQQVLEAGEGARGVVWGRRFVYNNNTMRWDEGPGHVFNVVNRNGRAYYVDGQSGSFALLEPFNQLLFLPSLDDESFPKWM